MLSLSEVKAGNSCTIVWLLGQIGDYLHEVCNFTEEDRLDILFNDGKDGIIVNHDHHRYAIDSDVAKAVRVELN